MEEEITLIQRQIVRKRFIHVKRAARSPPNLRRQISPLFAIPTNDPIQSFVIDVPTDIQLSIISEAEEAGHIKPPTPQC